VLLYELHIVWLHILFSVLHYKHEPQSNLCWLLLFIFMHVFRKGSPVPKAPPPKQLTAQEQREVKSRAFCFLSLISSVV